jgi:phosphatidate cytidylyltransferase
MLRHRLAVGLPLVGLGLASFLLPGLAGALVFGALILGFALVAGHEFFELARRAGLPGHERLTVGSGCLYLALAGMALPPGLDAGLSVLVLAGLLFACFAAALKAGPPTASALAPVWVSVGGFLYLFWCLSFLLRLFALPDAGGRWLVLYLVAITKMADTGAYVAGTLTARRPQGNHKLLPAISPKKSWEGLAGATVVSVVASLGLVAWLGDRLTLAGTTVIGWPAAVLLGVVASLVGLLGDLSESALKRAAAAKDSGRIPGLGGALDVLDSLVPMAPLFYAYVCIAASP